MSEPTVVDGPGKAKPPLPERVPDSPPGLGQMKTYPNGLRTRRKADPMIRGQKIRGRRGKK